MKLTRSTILSLALLTTSLLLLSGCSAERITFEPLTNNSVDLFWKWLQRATGETEQRKAMEGYHRGRMEELERRSSAIGAGLAVVIVACIIVWAITGYLVYRLVQMRNNAGPKMAAPMMAPMVPASPHALPVGPKLVTQKVIGKAPPGFQAGPVRLA